MGGSPKWCAFEAVITGTDESRNMGDESLDSKVVNLHRGTWARKSRTSVEVKTNPPKMAVSGWGTSPPKPVPGTGVKGGCMPQALTRYMASSSAGMGRLEPLRSCSVASCGSREKKSASTAGLVLSTRVRSRTR